MNPGGVSLGVRWTIGDVSDHGWQALRLSILGAQRVFGSDAAYAVCVNSVPLCHALERVGPLDKVHWYAVSRSDLPPIVGDRFDHDMAEGVAWKLAPLRVFPRQWEISLDNDCILWDLPDGMRTWLAEADPRRCLLAEDARPMYGQFTRFCGAAARNAGIRGLPAGYPLFETLTELLSKVPQPLVSELDEQGLQVAAVSALAEPAVVSIDDVAICSPFPPHRPHLGRCGAHFCGLNARHFAWQLDNRPAEDWIRANWEYHLPTIRARVSSP